VLISYTDNQMPKKKLSFRALANSHHQNLTVEARRQSVYRCLRPIDVRCIQIALSSRIKKRDDGELIGAYFYNFIP
jgi:hypothetical protein